MFSKDAHVKDTIRASIAIAACLAVLGAFVVVLGGYRFWEKLDVYYIRFKSVKDLSTGRPVKYGGLDVGRILSVGVDQEDPRMILVVIGLATHLELRQGTVARIAQKGLVGDYYVFLDPQGDLGDVMPPGSFIPAIESVDLSQLAGMAGEILADLRPKIDRIATSLEQILSSDNAARLTALLEKAPGLVEDLRQTSEAIRTDMGNLSSKGQVTLDSVNKTFKTLDQTVDSVKRELERTLADIQVEVKQLGTATDSVNKAVRHDQAQLEDILANVDRLSTDLKNVSARLRERPWELINSPRERKP